VNRKIGLTGGIASGKSSVAKMLSRLLVCEHVDADAVCRQLLEPHAEGWREFTRKFGTEYLTENETIDRPLLRKDLFASEKLRREVNNIVHPLAKKVIVAKMDLITASDPKSRVLVEVPLLYEVQWQDLFDTVIVVYADYKTCLHRLVLRDNVEKTAAEKELQSQRPLSEKVLHADHVIDNSGLLQDTMSQVKHLAGLIQNNGAVAEKKA
jgi:dephospho-CoA kinase